MDTAMLNMSMNSLNPLKKRDKIEIESVPSHAEIRDDISNSEHYHLQMENKSQVFWTATAFSSNKLS